MLHRLMICALVVTGCKDNKDSKPPPAADPVPAAKPAPPADKPALPPPPAETTPAPAPAPAADGWTTYTSTDGHFTVELPTPPKVQGQMAMSEFGASSSDSRTSGCGVTFIKNPNASAPPADILAAMSKSYKVDATVIEDKEITLGPNPGRSVIIQNSKHRKWIRLYAVGDKLYLLNCGAPFDRGDQDAPTAKRVLDSFKLSS